MASIRMVFLRVGQGDSILVSGSDDSGWSESFVIDLPQPQDATERLAALGTATVSAVYVTHRHADHVAPFAEVVRFVKGWNHRGHVDRVLLPRGMIQAAYAELQRLKSEKKPEAALLKSTLEELLALEEDGVLVSDIHTGHGPTSFGPLTVVPLHPSFTFIERFRGLGGRNENETSLVLRLDVGEFSALLLADVESAGVAQLAQLPDEELAATIVKIPHHGAWPTGWPQLEDVLRKSKAEVAVLSVGSCNNYRHVRPELFGLLLKLRTEADLKRFLCTEVTRTCVFDSAMRAAMGMAGLPANRPCAGEITVTGHSDGTYEVVTELDHAAVVAGIERAACANKADLTTP